MNIPETKNLTVRTWSKILYNFYSTTIKKLPAPKLTSPNGKYSYTPALPYFMHQANWEYSEEEKGLMAELGIKTKAEKFCYMSNLVELYETPKIWKSDKTIPQYHVVGFLADSIKAYKFIKQCPFGIQDSMFLLIKNNIFEGISETNLENWLGPTNTATISVTDTKILVENTRKFFSQYLA